MYDNGEGVPQDYKEAVRWYRLSAEQGHAGAQSNLGLMHILIKTGIVSSSSLLLTDRVPKYPAFKKMNPDQRNDLKQKFQSWKKKLRRNANESAPSLKSFASYLPKKNNVFEPPVKDLKTWLRNGSKNYANDLKTCLPKTGMIFASELKKEGSG